MNEKIFSRKISLENFNYCIKEIEIDDAEKFLNYVKIVGNESDNLTFNSDEIKFTIEEEKEIINTFRKNENELILKAETESGEIIAALTFRSSNRLKISHVGEFGVSVLKDYWGNGIAKELILSLEKWATESGLIKKINLRVLESNLNAIKLYKKLGYKNEGKRSLAYKIDEKFYDELLMGKEL